MMSTLAIHCQWEDEMMRERNGHPPSYAGANKMKSLTLHTHSCIKASLRDSFSSSSRAIGILTVALVFEQKLVGLLDI